jgi:hypothetical protein
LSVTFREAAPKTGILGKPLLEQVFIIALKKVNSKALDVCRQAAYSR